MVERNRILTSIGTMPFLHPDRLAIKPIESIDIVPVIEKFSDVERKALFKNLIGIELTTGCTSGCSDCYLMIPHGVTSRVSFSSFEEVIRRYHEELPEYVDFHYGNEPFDWSEGDKGLVDIYKTYKKYRPQAEVNFITYFPKGSEDQMSKVISEMIKHVPEGEEIKENIRISLRQKSPDLRHKELLGLRERTDVVKKKVREILGEKYSNQIERFFYEENFMTGLTFIPEKIQRTPLGKDFSKSDLVKRDRMQSEVSISCSDGVVLSSKGFRGVIMDSLSLNNPRGETHWDIKHGDEFRTPIRRRKVDTMSYEIFIYELTNRNVISSDPLILPNITTLINRGGEIVENDEFSMSREVRAYRQLVNSLAEGLMMAWTNDKNRNAVFTLYDRIHQNYLNRRGRLMKELSNSPKELEEKYYHESGRLYLNLLDFLFGFINKRIDEGLFNQRDILNSFSWANKLGSIEIEKLNLEKNLNLFIETMTDHRKHFD